MPPSSTPTSRGLPSGSTASASSRTGGTTTDRDAARRASPIARCSRPGPTVRFIPRPDRLERLKDVLRRARSAGLVVDVSFTYEAVRGASALVANANGEVCGSSTSLTNRVRLEPYARALGEVARALSGPDYRHVFFDLQNEWNGGWTRLSAAEIATLAERGAAVRPDPPPVSLGLRATARAAGGRPRAGQPGSRQLPRLAPEDAAGRTRSAPRSAGWRVRSRRQVSNGRYMQGSPRPRATARAGGHGLRALDGARTAGAAAWTFHTRAGFRLDVRGFPRAAGRGGPRVPRRAPSVAPRAPPLTPPSRFLGVD